MKVLRMLTTESSIIRVLFLILPSCDIENISLDNEIAGKGKL